MLQNSTSLLVRINSSLDSMETSDSSTSMLEKEASEREMISLMMMMSLDLQSEPKNYSNQSNLKPLLNQTKQSMLARLLKMHQKLIRHHLKLTKT